MPCCWPWAGPVDDEPEPQRQPAINQGKRRGVTKSPKPKPRRRR